MKPFKDIPVRLYSLLHNALVSRDSFFRDFLNKNKDINSECGYPDTIKTEDYASMYARNGIAKRVVNALADESWGDDPELYETEEADVETEFEKQWKELQEKFGIWSKLHTADKLSGIGAFGVILLGINDGKSLSEPVEGFEDGLPSKPSGSARELIYIRCFQQSAVTVSMTEKNVTNPRFGLPTYYSINFSSDTKSQESKKVHWSRIIHLADNKEMSEVYGTPRMKGDYDRLLDLRKLYGGSAEMFWKGAFPGYAFEGDSDTDLDGESVKKEYEKYSSGLQRYLAFMGLKVKSLAVQVADPSKHIDKQLEAISISTDIPKRILMGSERGELSSSQDSKSWNKRLMKRQGKYITPSIIRPFVDRLILLNILPAVKYFISWPDLNTQTEKEKAEIADKETAALAKYVSGDISSIMAPEDYYSLIMKYSTEEIKQIVKNLDGFVDDTEENEDVA